MHNVNNINMNSESSFMMIQCVVNDMDDMKKCVRSAPNVMKMFEMISECFIF